MGRTASSEVSGTCHEQYLPVKKKLEELLRNSYEENVQLCVYVDGQCVVDLVGTTTGDSSYNADSLQTIFSSGKSLEPIVMGLLYDKGLFKFEDKVIQHWPEFGGNDKENVRICDVLRHEGGLSHFKTTIPTIKDAWTENIKLNKIGELIEKEPCHFPSYPDSDSKGEYHALTRGMIINEIVRRIDPKGRTMQEIIKEDINIDGIFVSIESEEDLKRVHALKPIGLGSLLKEILVPHWIARKKQELSPSEIVCTIKGLMKGGEAPPFAKEMEKPDDLILKADDPDFRKAQVSSCYTNANARGLAKLASIMAMKGQPLMSNETWHELHSEPEKKFVLPWPGGIIQGNFTKSGINYFDNSKEWNPISKPLYDNRNGFYGWHGLGGSVFQWNPELKIGFAFVPTMLHALDVTNRRAGKIQKVVLDCVQK